MRMAMLLLLLLGGCVENDPLVREGLWRPARVNQADLVMQVANPRDLVRGRAAPTNDGQLAAAAVARLRQDKLKKLPATEVSDLQQYNAGSNNSAQGQ